MNVTYSSTGNRITVDLTAAFARSAGLRWSRTRQELFLRRLAQTLNFTVGSILYIQQKRGGGFRSSITREVSNGV